MACATLKRSLEFDPLHSSPHGSRPSKRRRCAPMCISPTSSPAYGSDPETSSPFGEIANKMTSEKVAANIREELRRIQRRKQLNLTPHVQAVAAAMAQASASGSESSDMESVPASPPGPSAWNNASSTCNLPDKDLALFSFKQVAIICQRALTEQAKQIREEYDEILSLKLSEQYNTFVQFTHDQIHKQFASAAAPSYLS